MVTCNTTLEDIGINEVKLSIGITFHELAIILCAIFGLGAIAISLYLMIQHALHYSRPIEQKHIIRIIFMIPVYSVANYLQLVYYKKAVYFETISACYEAFAISSFFELMCNYLAPTLHDQKDFFRQIVVKNWSWITLVPLLQKCTGGKNVGLFRRPRSGLTWFNVVWICIFQYCFVRIFFTIVSVIAEATGTYCEPSLSPAFAHIWVVALEAVSVTIAMVGLIQFYYQLKEDLAEHKPGLKLLCIKLVIFFSFWQSIIISLASSSSGPFQPTKYIGYQDIKNGIPGLLSCIEMFFFAILHVFAFPWRKPYKIQTPNSKINSATPYAEDPMNAYGSGYSGVPKYYGGTLGWRAFMDAANPWDIIKAMGRGARWLVVGRKTRHLDSSYQGRNGSNGASTLEGTHVGTKLSSFSSDESEQGTQHGVIRHTEPTSYSSSTLPRYPQPYHASEHTATAYHGGGEEEEAWNDEMGEIHDSDHHHDGRGIDEDHRAGLLKNAAPSPTSPHNANNANTIDSALQQQQGQASSQPAFRIADGAGGYMSPGGSQYQQQQQQQQRQPPSRPGGPGGPGGHDDGGWM